MGSHSPSELYAVSSRWSIVLSLIVIRWVAPLCSGPGHVGATAHRTEKEHHHEATHHEQAKDPRETDPAEMTYRLPRLTLRVTLCVTLCSRCAQQQAHDPTFKRFMGSGQGWCQHEWALTH